MDTIYYQYSDNTIIISTSRYSSIYGYTEITVRRRSNPSRSVISTGCYGSDAPAAANLIIDVARKLWYLLRDNALNYLMKKPGNYKIPYFDRKKELEGVALASFWRRGLALTIDCVIVYVVIFALMILVGWILQGYSPRLLFILVLYFKQVWSLQLIIDIAAALLYFGLFVYFWNGYTPGKRLMRVRVVSLKKERITFWQAIDRAFLYMVSVLSLFFGFLRYFSNPARQTKHDKIVDTIVVDTRKHINGTQEENDNGSDN